MKICFPDFAPGTRLLDCSKLAINWKSGNNVTILRHDVIVYFFDVVVYFFDFFSLFLLQSLVTGPSFMPLSSLVLELRQFPFIKDWPEIWKLEIHPSEFCLISGDWGELGIPNLARTSLIKCYWMLQNARVTWLRMSKLNNLNNCCSSELILDNFGLSTEIFVSTNNPLRM